MTTLALLNGDWEIQFEDETNDVAANTGTRMLRYVSGVVRTTNEIYSAVAAATDEFQAMGFKNPMLPVTPNAYTMENKYFISRASSEMLREGTITADWDLAGSAGNNAGRGVLRVPYTGGIDFVASDVGKLVTQGTSNDTGTLLDFEVEPDGTNVAWIRPDDSTPSTGDVFDATGGLTVTNGTGATTSSTAATSGTTRFTAIQAIGSVPTATEVYIVQDRVKLANSTDNIGFQFWGTDPTVSLGIVSVLIRTHNAAASTAATDGIADGDLEVLARRYTSLYDNFRLNVAAGGFSALPLASAPDINNTTGYIGFTTDAWTGSLTPVSGDVLQEVSNESQKLVITDISGTGPNYTFEAYHTGDLGTFLDNDVLEDIGQTGTITLSSGETIVDGGPTDVDSGEGGTVTITLGATSRDHDNTGTAEPYSAIIDAQSNVPIAKVYERIKYVTRRGADEADLFGAGVNVPGETYRGLEALIYYDNELSGFVQGEDVTENGGTWSARSVSLQTNTALEGVGQEYITVTDQQTSLDSLLNNDTLDDETGGSVDVDTAGAGGAIVPITSPKSSPFGTFTGTQIFGAQGIDFRNPGAGDAQSYILTDDLGTLRSPPNTITYTVANTRAGDRVLVARDTGTSGVIDKDQFGGMTAVAASSKTITVAGTIDGEVPAASILRVVENILEEEHRYYYESRTTGASGIFTLIDITASTANDTGSTTTPTHLNDSTATFQTDGVVVGMLIQDTTNGDTYEVDALVSGFEETRLTIHQVFGTGGSLASGDAYEINETIQLYATGDDLFDLIIDAEEDIGTDGSPGSISNTLVKAGGTFGTVVQVRNGKDILPFEQNQDQGQTDTSVTAVRTPDTIAV